MVETFQTFITSERERINSEREIIFNQQHELEDKLSDINRELAAIDAYEAAKARKPVRSRPRATGQTRTRLPQGRRGSKREALLKLIEESEGITRGEILEKMGLKGDKTGEM